MSVGSLGSLGLDLFVSSRSFEASLGHLPTSIERAARTMTRVADAVGFGIGSALGNRIIEGVSRFLGESIRTGVDFERAMSGVQAVTQATRGQFDELRETALRMGQSTTFSAQQIAEGMKELGQSGFRAGQILQALPGVANLAAAGELSLGEAAKIAAAAMHDFSLSAGQVGHVADVLAKAAVDSATDVRELGSGFRHVAPIAALMGKSIEQTVAPLELLANAGIRGTMAGTALRQVMSELAGESTEAKRLLGELGINADKLKLLPLADQIDVLNKRLKALGGADQASRLIQAFGQRAGPAFAVLLRQGGDELRRLEAGLQNAGGTAERVSQTRLNNVAGAWQRTMRQIQTIGISVFDALQPFIREGLDGLAAKIKQIGVFVPGIMKGIIQAVRVMVEQVRTLLAELEWAFTHWRDILAQVLLEIGVQISTLADRVQWVVGIVAEQFDWLVGQIKQSFLDLSQFIVNVAQKIATNAKGIWDFIRSGGKIFAFDLTPPAVGFTARTPPAVPAFQTSGFTQALAASRDLLRQQNAAGLAGATGQGDPFGGAKQTFDTLVGPITAALKENLGPMGNQLRDAIAAALAKAAGAKGREEALGGATGQASFTGLDEAWRNIQKAAFGGADPQAATKDNTKAVQDNAKAQREHAEALKMYAEVLKARIGLRR